MLAIIANIHIVQTTIVLRTAIISILLYKANYTGTDINYLFMARARKQPKSVYYYYI